MQVLEKNFQLSCNHFQGILILSIRILVLLHGSIPYILYSSQRVITIKFTLVFI